MSEIRFFKLLTGEFVVSSYEYQEKSNAFTLTDPAQVSMQQGENGQMQVGLLDFLPFAEENNKIVTISGSHVVYDHTPTTAMLNAYNKLYGSGLILPGSPSGLRLV